MEWEKRLRKLTAEWNAAVEKSTCDTEEECCEEQSMQECHMVCKNIKKRYQSITNMLAWCYGNRANQLRFMHKYFLGLLLH